MPRNVEIKARVRDMGEVRARAEALSDAPARRTGTGGHVLPTPDGRLKLRVFPDGKGELIAYRRPDAWGRRLRSTSSIARLIRRRWHDLLGARSGCAASCGSDACSTSSGQTRIHLDDVEGLGAFLELEVVLADGQAETEGEAVARRLHRRTRPARRGSCGGRLHRPPGGGSSVMKLRTFATAAEFLDVVGPALDASEAENSLLLGIALRVRDGHRTAMSAPLFACVEDESGIPLVVAAHATLQPSPVRRRPRLPRRSPSSRGILPQPAFPCRAPRGAMDVVHAFARTWRAETGATCVGCDGATALPARPR